MAFIVMLIMCALAMLWVRPLEREQEQFAPPAQSVAI